MFGWMKTAAVAAIVAGIGSMASAEVKIQGAGATFPNPIYQRWATEYSRANPDVKIDYQSIGSGGGIKGITEKTVAFAGSDAPMNKSELEKAGGAANIVEIPSVAGAVVPAYNLAGVNDLKFTGELLADIYLGKISNWNDKKIAELNPDAKLPDQTITPVYRTDGSGTNFVFTNYLATQSEDFKGTIGMGEQVKWPLGQGGKGNDGVAAIVSQTTGALGYIEVNYANQNKIAYGSVQNSAGKFVKATADAVSAAGAGAVGKMDGNLLAANLWNQPGDAAYPIASFTYLIVYKDLNNMKSQEDAEALVNYLWWATHDGQKMATEMDYAPLAEPVVKKVEAALSSIQYQGNAIKIAGAR